MKKLYKVFMLCVFLVAVVINIFCVGCSNKQQLTVILHAGGGCDGLTYLNAQETFNDYYNQGFRYFEYDLKLSSDGRLIGTHAWEHLDVMGESITYQEFTQLKLSNNLTPVNEEWLMQTIMTHSDIKIVVDAKMSTTEQDAMVLERLEALEKIYNYDISSNIIPEIFSKEMWDIVKQTTSFDRYFFSHYKVYYSVEFILENFSDERIYGIAFNLNCDDYFSSQLYRFKQAGKKLFIFTPTTKEEIDKAKQLGADGVYVNTTQIVE